MLPIDVMIGYMGLAYRNGVVHRHWTDLLWQREKPTTIYPAYCKACMFKPSELASSTVCFSAGLGLASLWTTPEHVVKKTRMHSCAI